MWKALSEGSDCAGPLALVQTSAHVLRLGCYTIIPEQRRLGVTIQRARIEWEQREADNARGRMGGERGQAGKHLAVGKQARADWIMLLSACQSGDVRGKQSRELVGRVGALGGWAFSVSYSLFDASCQ